MPSGRNKEGGSSRSEAKRMFREITSSWASGDEWTVEFPGRVGFEPFAPSVKS